jgi:regulator of replication initiation timing
MEINAKISEVESRILELENELSDLRSDLSSLISERHVARREKDLLYNDFPKEIVEFNKKITYSNSGQPEEDIHGNVSYFSSMHIGAVGDAPEDDEEEREKLYSLSVLGFHEEPKVYYEEGDPLLLFKVAKYFREKFGRGICEFIRIITEHKCYLVEYEEPPILRAIDYYIVRGEPRKTSVLSICSNHFKLEDLIAHENILINTWFPTDSIVGHLNMIYGMGVPTPLKINVYTTGKYEILGAKKLSDEEAKELIVKHSPPPHRDQ